MTAASFAAVALLPLLGLLTGGYLRGLLEFGAGVLTLVSLSSSVVWGLIATDRVLLKVRHRLIAQAVHRITAVASLCFLVLHIGLKIASDHTDLIGALVPFGLGVQGAAGLIGLGSLAAYFMVIAGVTGALRSAFTAPAGQVAGRWRAIHTLAYPAWFAGLLHGLYAGRPAAGWVTTLYALTLLAVGAALSLRLLPPRQRRLVAQRLMELIRPEGLVKPTAEQSAGPRDPAESPLPGAGRIPGVTARAPEAPEPEPAAALNATRVEPLGIGSQSGISAAYRAVSPAAQSYVPSVPSYAEPLPEYGDRTAGTYAEPVSATYSEPLTGSYTEPGTGAYATYGDPAADPTAAPTAELPYIEPTLDYSSVPPQPSVPPLPTEPPASSDRWPVPSPPPPQEHIRTGTEPTADFSGMEPVPGFGTEPLSGFGTEATAGFYGGTEPTTSFYGTEPAATTAPGPSYPPPPGEPWQQSTGDRP